MNNYELINEIRIKSKYYLDNIARDERVLEAMLKVDRINFLSNGETRYAYYDNPASIGFGQTCSQPSMVAFMLDKLEIENGNTILEIGSGCGYAAAIASLLCKPDGFVYACEIIEELAQKLHKNLNPYIENIKILIEDGSTGFAEYTPFDRIFLSAGVSSKNFNENILISQLSENGILIYPESHGSIYKLKKINGKIHKEDFFGVSFVPLQGKNS